MDIQTGPLCCTDNSDGVLNWFGVCTPVHTYHICTVSLLRFLTFLPDVAVVVCHHIGSEDDASNWHSADRIANNLRIDTETRFRHLHLDGKRKWRKKNI